MDAEGIAEQHMKRKAEDEQARQRRRIDKKLARMNEQVAAIVRRAWEEGKEVDMRVRQKLAVGEVAAQEDEDMVKDVVRSIDFNDDEPMVELLAVADDPDDRNDCPGTQGSGKWLKVRKGITIDSGSAAFVMPETWLPGFKTVPSPGSKRGQKFIWATGKPAYNSGEKQLEFRIASGGDRRCTFQTSDVNQMLACVAGLADGAGPGGETNSHCFRREAE